MDLRKYWPSIPQTAFGVDLDSALAYTTVKQVKINDRHLGCFNYSWYIFVFAWVVGFQIFYGNNHYKLYDVKGTARVTIQQPTKGCNPNDADCEDRLTPLPELPYCDAYTGPPHPYQKHSSKCIYADQHELLPEGMLENAMFIPTRIDKMVEEHTCEPSPSNNYSCKKMWTMVQHDEDVYVADIEDFTLMLVSSYYRAGIRGTSTDHQGFYYECKNKTSGKTIGTSECKQEELDIVPIKCIPGLKCKYKAQGKPPTIKSAFLSKRKQKFMEELSVDSEALDRPDDSKDAFAIPDGDIMSVRKVLELAGLNLDGSEVAGDVLRKRGTIVTIKIQYANLRPMKGKDNPGYIYKIQERPMNEMKTELYSRFQGDDRNERVIENRHGIYLEATVDGSFGQFDIVFLLVMLTTSLALLSAGTTLVDMIVKFSSYADNKVEEVENEYKGTDKGDK
mmetsp:Transcript_21239/g.40615  ORF Transcript_21239/g.40615 Transcript_21239/m.40615 type:complete len:449 (-) Transcript_21239:64-1410(-)